jgi:coenzyme F420-reducing hydrogenase delta subunit
VKQVQKILTEIGMQAERIEMFNMSAAMAGQFVEACQAMNAKVTVLGPNPLRHEASQAEQPEASDGQMTDSGTGA